jgi:hypothetical protein
MAFPTPGPVGPPVDPDRPPGSYPGLGHYLAQRFTQPGNSVANPGDWLHALLNPRAALAAGLRSPLGQAAGILVPGARRGEPTLPQQQFLDAIRGSSTKQIGDFSVRLGSQNLFRPYHPEVQALARQLGMPRTISGEKGMQSAYDPLSHMFSLPYREGAGEAGAQMGLTPSENRLTWNRESLKPGVTELFGKGSGAGRPPPSTVAWLADLIRSIQQNR